MLCGNERQNEVSNREYDVKSYIPGGVPGGFWGGVLADMKARLDYLEHKTVFLVVFGGRK